MYVELYEARHVVSGQSVTTAPGAFEHKDDDCIAPMPDARPGEETYDDVRAAVAIRPAFAASAVES